MKKCIKKEIFYGKKFKIFRGGECKNKNIKDPLYYLNLFSKFLDKVIIFIAIFLFVLVLFNIIFVKAAHAQLIVEDIANLPHNILTSVKAVEQVSEQVKQYKLAVQEFELMVKNSAAPYFYVYDQVKSFDENVEDLKERFSQFTDPKEVDKYFKKYYDLNWYRSSPCFQMGGCSSADLDRLSEQRAERIKYLTNISASIKKNMTKWADDQKARYDRLKRLDQEVKKAEGHFQIQAYQAQYASEALKEIIQLNEYLHSVLDFLVSLNESNLERSLIQQAQSEATWQKPKIKKWQLQYIGE